MSDPSSPFSSLTERLEAIQRQTAGLRDGLEELSATATDESGLVSATVGLSGELTGVTFEPRAMRLTSHELSEMVVDAVRRAKQAANATLTERAQGLEVQFGAQMGELFGRPGDFSPQNRMDAVLARLESLDGGRDR